MIKKLSVVALLVVALSVLALGCGQQSEEAASEQPQQTAALNVQKVKLDVKGMTCDGCATGVQMALKKVEGVKNAKVSFEANAAEVEFDPSVANVDNLVEAVKQAGFEAEVSNLN